MCKELPVILVNKVVDPKRIIGKKWRAKEEERHKGSLTQKKSTCATSGCLMLSCVNDGSASMAAKLCNYSDFYASTPCLICRDLK
jgi:hypothetical protein